MQLRNLVQEWINERNMSQSMLTTNTTTTTNKKAPLSINLPTDSCPSCSHHLLRSYSKACFSLNDTNFLKFISSVLSECWEHLNDQTRLSVEYTPNIGVEHCFAFFLISSTTLSSDVHTSIKKLNSAKSKKDQHFCITFNVQLFHFFLLLSWYACYPKKEGTTLFINPFLFSQELHALVHSICISPSSHTYIPPLLDTLVSSLTREIDILHLNPIPTPSAKLQRNRVSISLNPTHIHPLNCYSIAGVVFPVLLHTLIDHSLEYSQLQQVSQWIGHSSKSKVLAILRNKKWSDGLDTRLASCVGEYLEKNGTHVVGGKEPTDITRTMSLSRVTADTSLTSVLYIFGTLLGYELLMGPVHSDKLYQWVSILQSFHGCKQSNALEDAIRVLLQSTAQSLRENQRNLDTLDDAHIHNIVQLAKMVLYFIFFGSNNPKNINISTCTKINFSPVTGKSRDLWLIGELHCILSMCAAFNAIADHLAHYFLIVLQFHLHIEQEEYAYAHSLVGELGDMLGEEFGSDREKGVDFVQGLKELVESEKEKCVHRARVVSFDEFDAVWRYPEESEFQNLKLDKSQRNTILSADSDFSAKLRFSLEDETHPFNKFIDLFCTQFNDACLQCCTEEVYLHQDPYQALSKPSQILSQFISDTCRFIIGNFPSLFPHLITMQDIVQSHIIGLTYPSLFNLSNILLREDIRQLTTVRLEEGQSIDLELFGQLRTFDYQLTGVKHLLEPVIASMTKLQDTTTLVSKMKVVEEMHDHVYKALNELSKEYPSDDCISGISDGDICTISDSVRVLTADDLITIVCLALTVLENGAPITLICNIQLIQELLRSDQLMGRGSYFLTTVHAAIVYLMGLGREDGNTM